MPLPHFREPDEPIGSIGTIGEFWRWALSDLLNNSTRGVLAEYIVGRLLGIDFTQPRLEWDAYDLLYAGYRIEVKSSAYIQTWHKPDSKRSRPSFGIAQRFSWDAKENITATEKKHSADLYVFCIFPKDPVAVDYDILNLEHWGFYVTSTRHLQTYLIKTNKTIGLARVIKICGPAVSHHELKAKVDSILSEM